MPNHARLWLFLHTYTLGIDANMHMLTSARIRFDDDISREALPRLKKARIILF